MEFIVDWNAVCLVCLQEGEMRSIYEKDDKDMSFCDQIIQCSNIEIFQGTNLPEQICNSCIDDLRAAYRFRNNRESSHVILKSFILVDGQILTDVEIPAPNGQIYIYKPPTGLNVKRIKSAPVEVKVENTIDDDMDYSSSHFESTEYIENDDEDNQPLSTLRNPPKQNEQEEVVTNPPDHDILIKTNFKVEKDTCQENKREEEPVEIVQPQSKIKKPTGGAAKRGRLRGTIQRSDLTADVTPDNISSLVANLTTVTYVRRTRDDEKPMKICAICGNSYKNQHAFESHMRRHRNEKPFSCEFCDRAFVVSVGLRRHMRVHTGQKPYACSYCNRRFSDFGSRIKHESTHTGERPYVCDTCGKAFAYSHVLTSHILTHTGEKRYGCAQCGKRFKQSHHLKAHLNTHFKNINKPPVVIPNVIESSPPAMNPPETTVLYQTNTDKVYEDGLTVLTAQPKI